jgi:hypothetical protein
MSERERWIVYPLLFLALGAAMRDKLFNLTRSQKVVCEALAVYENGDPQRPLAILGAERMGIDPPINFLHVDRVQATLLDVDEIRYRGQRVNLQGQEAQIVTPEQVRQWVEWMRSMGRLQEAQPEANPAPEQPPSGEPPGE